MGTDDDFIWSILFLWRTVTDGNNCYFDAKTHAVGFYVDRTGRDLHHPLRLQTPWMGSVAGAGCGRMFGLAADAGIFCHFNGILRAIFGTLIFHIQTLFNVVGYNGF